jgi:hypothetical protein
MSTGTDLSSQTGLTRLWLGNSGVVVPCKVYDSLTTVVQTTCNPWSPYIIQVTGTNGMQFSPKVTSEQVSNIFVFSSEVSKTLFFTYASADTQSGFDTQTFYFNQGLNLGLGTSTFTGATNMTTSFNAPMFVSNGNFYDVSSEVANSLPTDANGVPF